MDKSAYIGKTCPYCRTELKADDEIVICSACEMPHHKECWIENQGCTTFGCLGTIQSIGSNSAPLPNPGMTYCTQCGQKNLRTAVFCRRCGRLLGTSHQNVRQAMNETAFTPSQQPGVYAVPYQQASHPSAFQSEQEDDLTLQMLTGKNYYYYAPIFRSMKGQGRIASWNWAAFLATAAWFFYQKLYLAGGIIIAIYLICILCGLLGLFIVLSVMIFSGIMGNYLYFRRTERELYRVKWMPEREKSLYLGVNGLKNIHAAAGAGLGIGFCLLIEWLGMMGRLLG